MGKKRYTVQQKKRLYDGQCFFCKEDIPAVLDAHRVKPGEEGGKYVLPNMLTACANCHRMVHDNIIIIDRKYPSTAGVMFVHYWKEGVEYWEPEYPKDSKPLSGEHEVLDVGLTETMLPPLDELEDDP